MGAAIADYHRHGVAGRLRVFSPGFDEDEIPVDTLFRTPDEMPQLERTALQHCRGRVLDVGAGAGCHTLALQQMGHSDVTAIDISPLAVQTMQQRGVRQAVQQDFWDIPEGTTYDTVLMLMNGIGIVGTLQRMPRFFHHIRQVLTPGGQVLLDSSDISYLYRDEDGTLDLAGVSDYYGHIQYRMQYRRVRGEWFPWLYLDPDTLAELAPTHGFHAEVLQRGEHYDYLARLTRVER